MEDMGINHQTGNNALTWVMGDTSPHNAINTKHLGSVLGLSRIRLVGSSIKLPKFFCTSMFCLNFNAGIILWGFGAASVA